MTKKHIEVSSESSLSMPIKNMIGIVALVASFVFGYTQITSRLTSLETSRELFNADLLKKSEQKPTDQEQYLLLESISGDLEKTIQRVDEMMHNGVNIKRIMKDVDRLRSDVETLKDKVRKNGSQ